MNRYKNEIAQINEYLNKSKQSVELRPAKKEDISYLKKRGVPESICYFYEKAEPSKCIEINEVRLWPISELKTENEDATSGYVIAPAGYFVISSTITGDVYCLDLNVINWTNGNPSCVLVSHDEIYEGLSKDEFAKGIVKITSSFSEFLQLFVKGKLPSDFYNIPAKNT